MAMTDKNTNWDLCFTCQKNTKESVHSIDGGRKNLVLLLPKFDSKNTLGFGIDRIPCSEKELLQTLKQNQASYHPSCENICIICLNMYYRKK